MLGDGTGERGNDNRKWRVFEGDGKGPTGSLGCSSKNNHLLTPITDLRGAVERGDRQTPGSEKKEEEEGGGRKKTRKQQGHL